MICDIRGSGIVHAVARAIQVQLATEDVQVRIGQRELGTHPAARRIVFVPTGGVLEQPKRGQFTASDGTIITPQWGNRMTVEAHLHAQSMEDLDALWTDLLIATRGVLGPASRATRYTIDTEEPSGAAFVHGGVAKLTQTFEWDLLISRMVGKGSRVLITAHDLSWTIGPEGAD